MPLNAWSGRPAPSDPEQSGRRSFSDPQRIVPATVAGLRKLNLTSALQPNFLEKVAEYFNADDGE